MMIVTLNADIANGAMSRTRSTDEFAVGAKILRLEFSQQVFEIIGLVSLASGFESTWVSGG